MHVIKARNVNDAWIQAVELLHTEGVARPSRAGNVIEVPFPVTTVYERSWERVLFDPIRDTNPFFNLFESLWMLNGEDNIEWLSKFAKGYNDLVSDDGFTQHGAYGRRWRNKFLHRSTLTTSDNVVAEMDQLKTIIGMLRANSNERRAILQMWDCIIDLNRPDKKDVPCNVMAHFMVRNDALDLVVWNRSNDVFWGCYGANAVHFSFLLEYMAKMCDLPMGKYYQMSDSWHGYDTTFGEYIKKSKRCSDEDSDERWHEFFKEQQLWESWYEKPYNFVPLIHQPDSFDKELSIWMDEARNPVVNPHTEYDNGFFTHVATPMYLAWKLWKEKDIPSALSALELVLADDWKVAAKLFLVRRQK